MRHILGTKMHQLIVDEIEGLSMESPTDEDSEARIKLADELSAMLDRCQSIVLVY